MLKARISLAANNVEFQKLLQNHDSIWVVCMGMIASRFSSWVAVKVEGAGRGIRASARSPFSAAAKLPKFCMKEERGNVPIIRIYILKALGWRVFCSWVLTIGPLPLSLLGNSVWLDYFPPLYDVMIYQLSCSIWTKWWHRKLRDIWHLLLLYLWTGPFASTARTKEFHYALWCISVVHTIVVIWPFKQGLPK